MKYVISTGAIEFINFLHGHNNKKYKIPESAYDLQDKPIQIDILEKSIQDIRVRLYLPDGNTMEGWIYNGLRFVNIEGNDGIEDLFDGRFNKKQ